SASDGVLLLRRRVDGSVSYPTRKMRNGGPQGPPFLFSPTAARSRAGPQFRNILIALFGNRFQYGCWRLGSSSEDKLAMLPCRHVYVPYAEAAQRPNIVVDGAANERSVLTLSHWPKSGTPWPLKADTSVGIVFNYIDSPAWHRAVPAVTNNHFDEDGLIGLYCLIEPEHALTRRALLIDASRAGDFSVCRSREAARIAFAISRLADRDVSPWGADRFPEDYSDYCTFVYARLLQQLGKLIDDVEGHRALWADEDALLAASERAIASGEVTIEERPEVDLAI